MTLIALMLAAILLPTIRTNNPVNPTQRMPRFDFTAALRATAQVQQSEQLNSPLQDHAEDNSKLASPLPVLPEGVSLRIGTKVTVRLNDALDSGKAQNGAKVRGVLAAAVKTSSRGEVARGTAIEATVVSAAKAGVISSGGILTLQLTDVGNLAVVSDVLEFSGRKGPREVADAKSARGTEAQISPDQILTFQIKDLGKVPGMVRGTDTSVQRPRKATIR